MSYIILSEWLIDFRRVADCFVASRAYRNDHDRGCVGSHLSIPQLGAEDSTEHRSG